jgi:hypothetical protein
MEKLSEAQQHLLKFFGCIFKDDLASYEDSEKMIIEDFGYIKCLLQNTISDKQKAKRKHGLSFFMRKLFNSF